MDNSLKNKDHWYCLQTRKLTEKCDLSRSWSRSWVDLGDIEVEIDQLYKSLVLLAQTHYLVYIYISISLFLYLYFFSLIFFKFDFYIDYHIIWREINKIRVFSFQSKSMTFVFKSSVFWRGDCAVLNKEVIIWNFRSYNASQR